MSRRNWASKLTGGAMLCATLVLTTSGTAEAARLVAQTARSPHVACIRGCTPPNGTFAGVSCTPANIRANDCTAVGQYVSNRYGYPLALVERGDGNTWSVQSLPNPRGHDSDSLSAVSCPSAKYCVAVGYSFSSIGPGGGSPQTLAERWNGSSWKAMRTVNPAGRNKQNYLYGVSCTSSRACTAVGSYVNRHGADAPLAERWNGHSWKVQATTDPAPRLGSSLVSVSCARTTACTAVGTYYTNNQGGDRTLAEHWGGVRWRVQSTPRVTGATYVYLNGVSCSSSNACTAVGDSQVHKTLVVSSLAERWNGHHWTIQNSYNPPVSSDSYLEGVSCSAGDSCTAVGDSQSTAGPQIPLAEGWTPGSGWTNQPTTDPGATPIPGGGDADLYGVSCTDPSACNAVGYYPGGSSSVTLAEGWFGGVWNTQPTVPGITD